MCATKSNNSDRTCIICGEKLIGRSDKVFCNIKCNNQYHIVLRRTKNQIAKDTFDIITHNWYVLTGLLQKEKDKMIVEKMILHKLKFNFSFASKVENKNNEIDYFIFDLKYRIVKHNHVYIERCRVPHNEISIYLFKRWERRMQILNILPN